jgi:hypothetical protein
MIVFRQRKLIAAEGTKKMDRLRKRAGDSELMVGKR